MRMSKAACGESATHSCLKSLFSQEILHFHMEMPIMDSSDGAGPRP